MGEEMDPFAQGKCYKRYNGWGRDVRGLPKEELLAELDLEEWEVPTGEVDSGAQGRGALGMTDSGPGV